jgi:hypothetical protein
MVHRDKTPTASAVVWAKRRSDATSLVRRMLIRLGLLEDRGPVTERSTREAEPDRSDAGRGHWGG